ncbi:MAG: hypothetical protein ACREF6_06925 [Alphaproteobacteria bacterium]
MTESPVPVLATAMASFRFVNAHRRDLIRVGMLAVPAFLILDMAVASLDARRLSDFGVNGGAVKMLTELLLRAVIAAALLVAWHRVVMLGASERRSAPRLAFGPRELRYLVVWILLSAGFLGAFMVTAAVAVAAQFVAMLAAYLALLLLGLSKTLVIGQRDQLMIVLWISVFFALPVASYIAGRLSLVLPVLAVDRRRPFREAWRMSAGNGWRLVAGSLIVLMPMESLAFLCSNAAAASRASLAHYPFAVAAAVSQFLLIVLTGTILSLFSLRLDGKTGAADPYHAGVAAAE